MKLLYIKATGFRNIQSDCVIDFTAKSKKTSEDKEYELQEIADGLFTFNTVVFTGKNASGKTTFLDLIDCAYSILGNFAIESDKYNFENMRLVLIFYHEGKIYRYSTDIVSSVGLSNRATFKNQQLYEKIYYRSKAKMIFQDQDFKPVDHIGVLPEDTSIVFFVLKKKETYAIYLNSDGEGRDTYRLAFQALNLYRLSPSVLSKILHLFDSSIESLRMLEDEHNYELTLAGEKRNVSDKELFHILSSGTTKGLLLYTLVVASLKYGFDLILDEIENHFHRTLVENIISLYKDKSINKHNSTLYFSTHYCELMDLFTRQDNIWICRNDSKIIAENMYGKYNIRSELSKSRQFYNDTFQTSVNYVDLMSIKKEFMK